MQNDEKGGRSMEQKQEPQRPKIGTEEVRRAAAALREMTEQ